MRTALLIIGTILPLISCGVYILSILKGDTRPQRMTHFLMALITGISFFALLASGDTSGIWLALVSCLQAFIILGLSFKWGMGGRDKLDIVCCILCIVGLILWLYTGQSAVGLMLAIAADCMAVIPAFVKTLRFPGTEIWLFYGLDSLAGLFIFICGPYDCIHSVYPLYILIINGLFVWAIKRRHRPKKLC